MHFIGHDGMSLIVKMKPVPGQSGYCGNFNKKMDDDAKGGKATGKDLVGIPTSTSFFKMRATTSVTKTGSSHTRRRRRTSSNTGGTNYQLVHNGHCNGGWKPPNYVLSSLQACRDKCAVRPGIGYFAFNGKDCACYLSVYRCPRDNKHRDFNAYRILSGSRLSLLGSAKEENQVEEDTFGNALNTEDESEKSEEESGANLVDFLSDKVARDVLQEEVISGDKVAVFGSKTPENKFRPEKLADMHKQRVIENCSPHLLKSALTKCNGIPEKEIEDDCKFDICVTGHVSSWIDSVAAEILEVKEGKGIIVPDGYGRCLDHDGKVFSELKTHTDSNADACVETLAKAIGTDGVRGAELSPDKECLIVGDPGTFTKSSSSSGDGQGIVSRTSATQGWICWKLI